MGKATFVPVCDAVHVGVDTDAGNVIPGQVHDQRHHFGANSRQ